jgi:hypothetical protein
MNERFELFKERQERFEKRKRKKDVLVDYIGLPLNHLTVILLIGYSVANGGVNMSDPIPPIVLLPSMLSFVCLIVAFLTQAKRNAESHAEFLRELIELDERNKKEESQ